MQWIEAVERRNGAFGVVVSNAEQSLSWRPASDLNWLLPAANRSCRRRISTDFAGWSVSSPRAYFDALGCDRDVTDGHQVFSFDHDGTQYLVPAVVVIEALCRPLRYVASWLFRPSSLELVSTPVIDGSGFSAMLALSLMDPCYLEATASRNLFTWLWAYPSARRMWHSVYTSALGGKLGLMLPKSAVRAIFHGVINGNTVAVTAMRVMEVTADERSDLEVVPVTNAFMLHAGLRHRPMARGDAERKLIDQLHGQPRPLTDDQWEDVRGLVQADSKHFQHDQRIILDSVLAKLVTGQPWLKLSYRTGDWRHASTAYRRWKTRGVWETVCERLVGRV